MKKAEKRDFKKEPNKNFGNEKLEKLKKKKMVESLNDYLSNEERMSEFEDKSFEISWVEK